MGFFKSFGTAFCFVLLAAACNRSTVSLQSTTAHGEVPQLGNLVFRFSQSLMPDSLINDWDSSEYVSFKPAIRGRFRWQGPDELVFSPSQPLQPATTYKATVRDEVLRYTKFKAIKDAGKTEFHTAPLQLEDAQVTWVLVDEGTRAVAPQLQLLFNYPVKAETIQEKLHVQVDGAAADVALQTAGTAKAITLRLSNLKAADKTYEATVTLDKGVVPVSGANATDEAIATTLSIPSPFVLTVNSVEAEHDGTEGLVHIYTSQQVAPQNMVSLIQFKPQVKFTVSYDAYGITVRSDAFDAEQAYNFTIAKGLRGTIGGTLREDYDGSAAFGNLEASIRFTNSKAMYLSRQGSGNIEVRITNVPKVKLIISKIYENNLLMAQRSGYYPQDNHNEESASYNEEADNARDEIDATAGDIIYSKVLDTRSLPKRNGTYILNLAQFEDRLPEAKGIYHISLRSLKEYWTQDSRFISRSDIGLIAKRGTDKLFVFANSIKSATALSGINVSVYGANNQLLGTAPTNNDGVAEVTLPARALPGFIPAMVIAKTADDFTYLPFNNTKVATSRFDVGGKRANASGLDAFIYAGRDIYRPGETAHYAVVLRDKDWKSPGTLPVKIKFVFPNGKEWQTLRKGLNEQGATEGSLEIPVAALTGSYNMEVYTSNDVLLASKTFSVEEFMPDRIRVATQLSKTVLQPSDAVQLQVEATNFFGPPAANRKWETEIQVKAKTFSNPQWSGYDFALTNGQTLFEKEVREGTTDADGKATIGYIVPALYKNTGLLQTAFYTTVFDETGRPVSKYTTADVITQPVFFGIKDNGYYYVPLNQSMSFDLVAVDVSGKTTNATATVQIIKHEYKTVLSKSGSYFRYESQQENKILETKNTSLTGKGSYAFIPRSPGDYELRLYSNGGATAYVSKSFYSYGSWGGDAASFDVNTEGEIDMALDKEKYTAGEKAKILFKTPFSGRMLVTTERDGVLSYQYLDVAKRSASLDLELSEAQVPNVYVTATLFKPHGISDIPLTVAHGFKNITVEAASRKIPVVITAQKTARSHTHQIVSVKAAPGSYVTLAAVDNGVLQVSDFKTPDPYNYFYQKKALGVQAYDMYPLLFAEVRGRTSSTGGDGDLELEKRINPMPAKRVQIVSYWSGMKKAGGSGSVNFEFDVPQFSGELRLMAAAFKDAAFGASEATLTVADPLVLSASLPRFLSPGDTALVPLSISNTTSKVATGQASIAVTGPFKILTAASQKVSLQPKSESTALFQVVATSTLGVGKISTAVLALGERFNDETEISVRPPSTLQKVTGNGSVASGSKIAINLPNDFLPGSSSYQLSVSASPVGELGEALRYLVQYPYGCTEQVISSAFSQLYYSSFINNQAWGFEKVQAANSNVQEAIRKIALRQLYNGGILLWDDGTENWWTTVYAAHFLLEAKKAGYDVDNSLLETTLSYIASRLKNRSFINYYYNRDQMRKIAPKEVPYSLYVLALANRAAVSTMNYYKASPQLLALDGKYLLSAAYAVAGDKRQFAAFLPGSFSGEESVKQSGGSFYSAVRDEGVALNALLDADPGNEQVPVMARHLVNRLKTDPYLNTQERAFAFLALGKLARNTANNNVTGEIRSGGKLIGTVNGTDWKSTKGQLQPGALEIVAKGAGRLYYSWSAEGISPTGTYAEEDNYLKVRRAFYDRYGRPLSATTFKQNDLVIVGITLEKSFDAPVENIVLTDLLPAGFEIENARTKELPGMDWIRNASEPTAIDVRDDRIHFFVDAMQPVQHYYYAVRAVSLGTFTQGPVSADAMYKPEYHSYHGAGTVRVVR